MTIKTKKVYISEDGKEFDTIEECQKYEKESSFEALEYLKQQREMDVALKNRYKANKYGKLPTTERELQMEYDYITKMRKTPIENISDKNIQYLASSFKTVEKLRLQKKQQKMVLDDLKVSINIKGERIKKLYEKLNS